MSEAPSPHRCWVEVDASALQENARVARSAGFELIAVVKANGYGHGAVRVARCLEPQVGLFGVATLAEARELIGAGLSRPILLLGTVLPHERLEAARRRLHISLSSPEEAEAWSRLALDLRLTVPVHAVVDTGMGRIGFPEETWTPALVSDLLSLGGLDWQGLASHFPSADEDAAFTLQQIQRFRSCVETASDSGLRPPMIHLANSAGLLGFAPHMKGWCTHARPGLMLYGVNPLEWESPWLHTTMVWKSRVTLVRTLPPDHGVSYGRTYLTSGPTRVATVAIGYADGLHRQLSGQNTSFAVRGHRCPLLGRITMDQVMLNVTHLPFDVLAGEEVVLFGHRESGPSVEEIARKAGTIPWEIFTGIGLRVDREWTGGPHDA